MSDITSRHHIRLVVETFYAKVRRDPMLGPVFNEVIGSEENWEKHFEKLTDFWETNLLGVHRFKGNPMLKHQLVDNKMNQTISEHHFGQWLHLWVTTLNSLFQGETTERAKASARRMGTFMLMKIFEGRSKNIRAAG